ncbi:MAG: NUDIX hydrolase [Cyanobacteria bacterium SBLK]|nr:NUDIX hydrolase [Cyanobacteria bacterium SBLK]
MTEIEKWKILQSQFIVDNRWCRVRKDCVQLPDGEVVDDYFIHVRPDIALVLPITGDRNIVFVRQYRHGVGQILLELPAGSFDPQRENSVEAAKRELEEETGYYAEHLHKLATLYDNPVKDTNAIHLFLAEGVIYSGKRKFDITEDIEIVLIPLEEVAERIKNREICVAGTLSALFLGLNYLNTSQLQSTPYPSHKGRE